MDRQLNLLSVVAPMLNEEQTVEPLYARVRAALEGVPFEFIVVDDGSTDRTPELLERIASSDPRVRVVRLARTFGHQMALTAGLDHAAGDAVVMIDGDLQDPPEVIPTMLERWRGGGDVVVAVRRSRVGETRFKLSTARWFYRVIAKLTRISVTRDAGDFRLLDRRALDALLALRERSRFLRGMTEWVGFEQAVVEYDRDPRYAGDTKYTTLKMVRFALDAVASFSYVPLQIAAVIGFVVSVLAFLGIPVAIALKYAGWYVPGIASIAIVVLLLGGLQLMALGLIGEYIGRIYEEVKRRPLYVVRDRLNISDKGPVQGDERERITSW